MMKIILSIFLILLTVSPVFGAGTCGSADDSSGTTHCTGTNPWTADSASYEDVNQCVNTCATYNDTVNVPAGDVTWPQVSILVITKAIKLTGNGIDSTIIGKKGSTATSKDNCMIKYEPDATSTTNNYEFRFSGFTLQHIDNTDFMYDLLTLTGTIGDSAVRNAIITNNKFVGIDGALLGMAVSYNFFGVAYGNQYINLQYPFRYLVASTLGWSAVEEWEIGTDNAFYFEDNIVTAATGKDVVVSGGRGIRVVIRYNTFNCAVNSTPLFDIHGYQTAAGIGLELYGNKRVGAGNVGFLDCRGGQCIAHHNYCDGANTMTFSFRTERHSDLGGGIDANVGTTYLTTALGNYDQSPHWSYIWDNYIGENAATINAITEDTWDKDGDVNNPLTIVENQSHWVQRAAAFTGKVAAVGSCGYLSGSDCTASGIGCGTLANRPACTVIGTGEGECTLGVAYWVPVSGQEGLCTGSLTGYVGTNATPIRGTLYKLTGAGTWESYYTPYQYPHPLRGNRMSLGSGAAMSIGAAGGAVMTLQ